MIDLDELIAEAREYTDDLARSYGVMLIRRLADALEAATRVPVQGEPNDDRERIAAILQLRHPGNMYSTCERDADAILAAGFSRATVPDAATELRAERDAALAEIESRIEDRDYWHGVATTAKDQRDAALAAIERVREIHVRSTDWVMRCASCDEMFPCLTVAALDGAPEPEALELPETGLEVRDGDGDLITTGEHRRVLHQGGYVCDTCVNVLGINVRWDRADRMEGHPLPVEGEKP